MAILYASAILGLWLSLDRATWFTSKARMDADRLPARLDSLGLGDALLGTLL